MQRAFTARAGQPGMPAIELLEGFELLEGIQRGGGYQVKRRRRLRIELELLEGFELLELIEGALQRAFTARRRLSGFTARRATW